MERIDARRSWFNRVHVVAVAVLGLALVAAYNDNHTPLMRTVTSNLGCSCSSPGANPTSHLHLNARKLELRGGVTGDQSWLLPLNRNVGIDLRDRSLIPPTYADRTLEQLRIRFSTHSSSGVSERS